MTLKLIAPILKQLKSGKPIASPAPSVQVTESAETAYYKSLREQMKLKVWEKDGGVVRLQIRSSVTAPSNSSSSLSSRGTLTPRRACVP